jgi:hypothetical protein
MSWRGLGKKAAENLKGVTDEDKIEAIALELLREINEGEEDPKKRENARKAISEEIRRVFPRMKTKAECIEEKCLECYYHDPLGKKVEPRWRHLVFKYLKLNSADYDAVGGEARAKWKAEQAQHSDQVVEAAVQQQTEPVQVTESQVNQKELNLKDMTIEQLGLDTEATQKLEQALKQSGKDLESFIRTAVQVYSNTIVGKSQKHTEDLTMVSTQNLLTDKAYTTHPGRAKELTKRAIQAIKRFNAAVDPSDRWCITPSAIALLTGSKHSTIQSFIGKEDKEGNLVMQGDYWDEVKTHNQTYKLNGYSNRKPGKKIEEVVKLAELVPSGLD